MIQVENIEDFDMDLYGSPTLTRKTSDCLAVTNLTMGSFELCSTIQFQSTVKQCRICLDHLQDQVHVFVSPCKCTGSLKYVHHDCFLHWLERQYLSRSLNQQRLLKEEGLQCQICKQKIYLGLENVRTCLKTDQISSKITRSPTVFLVLLIFAAVIGASLAFVIYFMQNKSSNFGQDALSTSVLLCALVFLLVASSFTLYYIIIKYCMEVKNRLTDFSHRKLSTKTKKRKLVYPYRN